MTKTGKRLIVLVALTLLMSATNIRIEVPETGYTDTPFEVKVIIEGDQGRDYRVKIPDMSGIEVLSRSQYTSTNISIIGTRQSIVKQKVYSFSCIAKDPGTYTIGPFIVSDGQHEYKTEIKKIKIIKAQARPYHPRTRPSPFGISPFDDFDDLFDRFFNQGFYPPEESDIFVQVEASKRSVFVGEPFILYVYLFSTVQIDSIDSLSPLNINNAITHEIETKVVPKRRYIGNQLYIVYLLKRYAVIPLEEGELSIPRVKIKARTFFVPEIERSSKAFTIHVKPLSVTEKDKKIYVGEFNFKIEKTDYNVKLSDVVEVNVTITGKGDITGISPIIDKSPDGLKFFKPTYNLKIWEHSGELTGKKVATFLISPQKAGDYKFSIGRFVTYNREKKAVETFEIGPIKIHAEKTEGSVTTNEKNIGSKGVHVETNLDTQIRPITQLPMKIMPVPNPIYTNRWFFWILFGMPSITVVLFFLNFIVEKIKRTKDINRAAAKSAISIIKKMYKDGKINKKKLENLLREYLKNRWGEDTVAVDSERLHKIIVERGCPQDLAMDLSRSIKNIESKLYDPTNPDLEGDIKELIDVMEKTI